MSTTTNKRKMVNWTIIIQQSLTCHNKYVQENKLNNNIQGLNNAIIINSTTTS